jgi:aminotransferase
MINENNINSINITERAKRIDDSIILSIGDPHFSTDDVIVENSFELLRTGTTNYSDSQGLEELREAIINGFEYKNYSYQDLVVTPGSKQGLLYVLKTLPRDSKVLLFEPHWHSYTNLIKDLNLNYQVLNSYDINFIEKLKMTDFDVLIVCNPNNPDGYILNKTQMDDIIKVIKLKDAILIADEIYSNYDYESSFVSFSKYNSDRIIILNGFSKRYAMTGWRLGFILCSDHNLVEKLIKINQLYATCVANISQYCGIAALNTRFDSQLLDYYKKNSEIVLEYFPLAAKRLSGGFYAFVDLTDYGVKLSGEEFSDLLFKRHKIAVVPGSIYGNSFKSYFRLSFSVDREILIIALYKILNLIESLD